MALGLTARLALRALFSVALIVGCASAGGCDDASSLHPLAARAPLRSSSAANAPANSKQAFRFFSPTSFWNQPLPADAPLAAESSALVGDLDTQVAALEASGAGPWINTRDWSVPVYTVSARQPTVRVRLVGAFGERALQSAWDAVPLPPAAQPALGKDAHLVVWQPSSDRLWEFWHLTHGAGGWSAEWGGAIRHVSNSSGVYGPRAWPGAKSWWGASASSLSIAGGLITLSDLRRGSIDHALAISIADVRAGVYASPARRDDGVSTDPLSLPEGARLRLPPNLDLGALHLPRLTLEIARAAQRYGLIVRDRSFAIAFFAQDPIPTGTEPYAGAGGYFEGRYPNQLLASFPWNKLEVLALSLHPNGVGSRRAPTFGTSGACAAGCTSRAGARPGG
ncbi:MAG TPA: hypothetical protein VK761_03155 [Solirubrobacteraceae bacterium]|nr:hypothetical protein [Solirubrobacteraceae bacterium]